MAWFAVEPGQEEYDELDEFVSQQGGGVGGVVGGGDQGAGRGHVAIAAQGLQQLATVISATRNCPEYNAVVELLEVLRAAKKQASATNDEAAVHRMTKSSPRCTCCRAPSLVRTSSATSMATPQAARVSSWNIKNQDSQ
eukprot:CAMPEP_0173310526 /NCGR_PEP_ID=MMETSP1143-20121109/22974_1 /TAXON_ID=483371 /ORGANISM="non described non described, Strain CCMP2298" /LENGTH=138 /DNA_ID=CAMNT_0014252317 /DNA_START=231 /DNA_END=647 /DNA_ORIENTATION=-